MLVCALVGDTVANSGWRGLGCFVVIVLTWPLLVVLSEPTVSDTLGVSFQSWYNTGWSGHGVS